MSLLANSTLQVNVYTSTIQNSKGQHLFCKYWEPSQRPRALVFLSHGYAEHSLLYEPLAQTLVSHNFLVFSHDHVGHGQSEGSRAQIDTFEKFVDDVFMHVDSIRRKHPNLDCFICGHSMGGAISILAALRKPDYFKGIILIGPAVATNPEVATPFKTTVAKILRWVAPQFPIATLDLTLVSSCPETVKKMEKDPLRFHGFCKAGFGASLVDACKEIQRRIPTITFPFIICQGEEDKLCTPEGAIFMYEKSASEDKTIKMYPKAYHSLLCEPDGIAEAVTQDILDWMTARS
ncbi:monoglyceride lipase-like [Argiope bruennichi]|uniref:Monoglyceride lipase like protein n=1 Tax=Argiope bruennichi TaxID=94029 RepID=A0A8T0FJK1_ARGBR|nr:monoglyceride lipase-like [Argiope bruennichi]KAF8790398.1 Monoglyceride lipase like protein [Argiope bruennichi]